MSGDFAYDNEYITNQSRFSARRRLRPRSVALPALTSIRLAGAHRCPAEDGKHGREGPDPTTVPAKKAYHDTHNSHFTGLTHPARSYQKESEIKNDNPPFHPHVGCLRGAIRANRHRRPASQRDAAAVVTDIGDAHLRGARRRPRRRAADRRPGTRPCRLGCSA